MPVQNLCAASMAMIKSRRGKMQGEQSKHEGSPGDFVSSRLYPSKTCQVLALIMDAYCDV